MRVRSSLSGGKGLSDVAVERMLSNLLRSGVVAAAVVVAGGGVAFLAAHGGLIADHRLFRGEPADLRSISSIASGALALRSLSIIQLGLLGLIATPVLRVAGSLVAFTLQRDWLYVVFTGVVLSLLVFGLCVGLR